MSTLTIQVEDNSVMAGLKKVLESMKGVVIVPNHQKSMSGIEEAMDDIRHGRVTEYDSDDLKIYAKFFGVYIGLSYLCSIND